MNKKFCDGCKKEIKCYNVISPDRYKNIKIETPLPRQREITDGTYEICEECYTKILLIIKPQTYQIQKEKSVSHD